MRISALRAACTFVLATAMTVAITVAHAAPNSGVNSTRDGVVAQAQSSAETKATESDPKGRKDGRTPKSKYTYVPKGEYAKRHSAYQADLDRVIRLNGEAAAAQARCTADLRSTACNGVNYLDLPADFTYRPAGDPAKPTAPVVSPQQAAYIAMARLRLTPPQPMIGPPPSINQWKMAAVGYPMWLWADGTLNPAPVTDTVYDLSVTLDARLVSITYTMGDGHKISCTDNTRRWTRSVPAAQPSPACGYTYQKPSLPKGDYTITAHTVWAVDWTVNGVRGTIAFYQSATTQLPVGELQVLTR